MQSTVFLKYYYANIMISSQSQTSLIHGTTALFHIQRNALPVVQLI
jgi:hypothetical protein